MGLDSEKFKPIELEDEVACTALAQSVVDFHADDLSRNGGFLSPRESDIGRVESIVSDLFMPWFGKSPSDRFVDIFEQLSFFAGRLACGHIFTDGNKRIAVRISLSLVARQGFTLHINDSPDPKQNELYDWITSVVSHQMTVQQLADKLRVRSTY